jgi:hypothetical protein
MVKDADSGKFRSTPKGLGKWKCSVCSKPCKVTVGKLKESEGVQSS